MADPRYPVIHWTGGSSRFNLLMTIAQTEATAHALGSTTALARFERAFDLLRRMEVFGVPSQARRDLLRAGEYHAIRVLGRFVNPQPAAMPRADALEVASWSA